MSSPLGAFSTRRMVLAGEGVEDDVRSFAERLGLEKIVDDVCIDVTNFEGYVERIVRLVREIDAADPGVEGRVTRLWTP